MQSCRICHFQRAPKIKGNRVATADEVVLIEPMNVRLDPLISLLSNHLGSGFDSL